METGCKADFSIEDIDEPLPKPTPMPTLNTAYLGDCIETMKGWSSEIVDCVVTSPPYFGLRSYLPKGHKAKSKEGGYNQTLMQYQEWLRSVFAEVNRITKPNGVMWVNVGDTWYGDKTGPIAESYHVGEMMDIPYLVSQAARWGGWRKIGEVVWHKTNANPHAVGKRPAYAHEPVFQFARSADSYYDPIPLQEVASDQPDPDRLLYRHARSVWSIPTAGINGRKLMADLRHDGQYRERDPRCAIHGDTPKLLPGPLFGLNQPEVSCTCKPVEADFFAAMPVELASRLIRCSTSDVGNCSVCGLPYKRLVVRERVATRPGLDCKKDPAKKARKDPGRHVTYLREDGWAAQCTHDEAAQMKPIVFDPFLGSGTTAVAAAALGRNWLGCELNPMMVERLIPARLKQALKG